MTDVETVPCETCGTDTHMTGTKRCYVCWEVEHRLESYLWSKEAKRFVARALDAALEIDSTPERVAITQECRDLRDLLLAKNAAYGNAALDPVRIFSRADPEEQIRVRLDDKLSRLARGSAAGEDVELDLLGYLILLRVSRRLRETEEA